MRCGGESINKDDLLNMAPDFTLPRLTAAFENDIIYKMAAQINLHRALAVRMSGGNTKGAAYGQRF